MNKKNRVLQITLSVVILIVFIIDPNTASSGVAEGIDMCLKVIIPSLFPFFVVSTYLNAILLGYPIPAIQCFAKLLQIPTGGESILLLGLIGGYPVGAKLIADLYYTNKIDKQTAHILLGYCNNAGPAFIFGIAGAAFASPVIPLVLWGIHITSAVITGFLLPKPAPTEIATVLNTQTFLIQAIKNSISACVSVCAWVIVFRVLLTYLWAWFHTLSANPAGIVLTGILELSNGCICASQISNPAIRFILFSVFFAFGGLCVLLQTASVTAALGNGLYIHGKIIQSSISLILASILGKIIFPEYHFTVSAIIILVLSIMIIIFTVWYAKKGRNQIDIPV